MFLRIRAVGEPVDLRRCQVREADELNIVGCRIGDQFGINAEPEFRVSFACDAARSALCITTEAQSLHIRQILSKVQDMPVESRWRGFNLGDESGCQCRE